MNINHACVCAAATTLPAAKAPPEQPVTTPDPVTAGVRQATVALTRSYAYVEYFSQAYVAVANQSSGRAGGAEGDDAQTAAVVAQQPKSISLAALQFGVSVMVAYAAVRQEDGGAAAGAAAEPGDSSDAADWAAKVDVAVAVSEKVITGTVRPALLSQAPEPADEAEPVAPASVPRPSADAPAAGEGAAAPAPAEEPAVQRVDVPELRKFRLKHLEASAETSFTLALETREGDRVTLEFSQVEALLRSHFRGRDDDGARFHYKAQGASVERLVSVEVDGDISEEERTAIDAVFDRVVEVANAFFGGSTATAARGEPGAEHASAMEKLRDMSFDTETLLDFSLQMSQSHRVEVTRGYRNDDAGLERLARHDVEVGRTLEYLGDRQRALVSEAREVLEDRSAARMVRSLLPVLLEAPKEALTEAIGEHPEVTPPASA